MSPSTPCAPTLQPAPPSAVADLRERAGDDDAHQTEHRQEREGHLVAEGLLHQIDAVEEGGPAGPGDVCATVIPSPGRQSVG